MVLTKLLDQLMMVDVSMGTPWGAIVKSTKIHDELQLAR